MCIDKKKKIHHLYGEVMKIHIFRELILVMSGFLC